MVRGSVSFMEACLHGHIIKIQGIGGLKVWKIETKVGFINCFCGSLLLDITQILEGLNYLNCTLQI